MSKSKVKLKKKSKKKNYFTKKEAVEIWSRLRKNLKIKMKGITSKKKLLAKIFQKEKSPGKQAQFRGLFKKTNIWNAIQKDRDYQVIKGYNKGTRVNEIADKNEINPSTVYRILHRNGVTPNRAKKR
jgi:hypothetical protein